MKTYRIEEVIENFNVIKAIYETTDLSNKWQLITAYGACKSLADLIDIKLANFDPDMDEKEVWGVGRSSRYFAEKVGSFITRFGYLAERTLKGEDLGGVKEQADHYLSVATQILPNGDEGWGPFVG